MLLGTDHLTFVLSHTQFASNLGSAVRVMKNMGFRRLFLVQPECEVGLEARSRAMKGADILDRSRLYPCLDRVRADLDLLVGTTSRAASDPTRSVTSRTFAEEILPGIPDAQVGIVFGSESNGLTREENRQCQWLLMIPTASDYRVINLAQAVAIVAYDLHLALSDRLESRRPAQASPASVQALIRHLDSFLQSSPLPAGVETSRILDRLQRLAGRTRLETDDVNMLRAVIEHLTRSGNSP